MQAQENSYDENTNDAMNELGELMEKLNLYQKTTVLIMEVLKMRMGV